MTNPSWLIRMGATSAVAASAFGQPNQSGSQVSPADGVTQVAPLDPNKKEETKKPSSLESVFKDIQVTDQHGEKINLAEVLKGKPALMFFGYNGCPRCGTIADSIAVIQQKLVTEKQEVPIIIVSVQPEKDSEEKTRREYIIKYYQEGLRQYQAEELKDSDKSRAELGSAAFDVVAKKIKQEQVADQKSRIFHIIFTPKAEDAKNLQNLISEELKKAGSRNMLITTKDPKQHTSFGTLFNAEGNVVEAYRALDANQQAPEKFTATLAQDISRKVTEIQNPKQK
ncbi:MAG: SCO family protein [Rickettsiales bacterium]|jgi:cytochrome oxidase Cu insertion factor (SCO1/SenC/PrrC family)|nr:SCO family protein [Rickettsiales bacterium]